MTRSQHDGSRRLVAFSAAIAWVAVNSTGCGEEPAPAPEVARPIKILELGGSGAGSLREFPGQVSAAQHVELAFEASGQLIEFPVREAQEVTKGQLLAIQLGRLKDRGEARHTHVSMAKRNNVSMACDVAREARRLLGANGILVEYQSMRHMANLESVYTYEGTHDIHGLIVGADITGISAIG